MSNSMTLAPGVVNPAMLAYLQAQRQAQGQFGQYAPQPRPGGDADVASFLLQLKTNQNGEPVTDAEALQQLNAARQQQQHLPQTHMPLAQAPATIQQVMPGYPQMALYNYPGMVAFPQANAPNAGSAAAAPFKFYNTMQPQLAHASQTLAPMQQPGGIVPGINHAQPPAIGMHGVPPAAAETGPAMTDAYIESLIAKDDDKDKKDKKESDSKQDQSKDNKTPISAKDDMNIALVVAGDRDLIPDALFVALGQMTPCRLQQSDRVGCYKTRAIGFLGMTCKHCGGQPGFGRYFPNSVRSLAQTTTSQTILKHIGGKCRFCPPHIRKAVLELQRQQAHKEHLSTGRPRYGSRKIFFQRMWARLHGPPTDGETPVVVQADVTSETAREEELSVKAMTTTKNREEPSPVSNNNSDDEGPPSPPPQGDRGVLNISTTFDNKRKLTMEDAEENSTKKKLRVSSVAV